MRMQTVVMLKPLWQLFQRGFGIRQVSKGHIVSLKSFDKALGHSIGLRTSMGVLTGLRFIFPACLRTLLSV
jgi:hypothetical protein